jgi:hypothetical protein
MMFKMNDPVAEFVAEARLYCALIENEQRGAASASEKECLVALLRLYEQILRLPSANPPDPELPERILYEKWQGVRERIAQPETYARTLSNSRLQEWSG